MDDWIIWETCWIHIRWHSLAWPNFEISAILNWVETKTCWWLAHPKRIPEWLGIQSVPLNLVHQTPLNTPIYSRTRYYPRTAGPRPYVCSSRLCGLLLRDRTSLFRSNRERFRKVGCYLLVHYWVWYVSRRWTKEGLWCRNLEQCRRTWVLCYW